MVILMKKKILSMLLCFTLIICIIPQNTYAQSSRDTSFEEELATDLKALGLFKGVSETNFDLNREPTRVEALVMLIRILGKESDALSNNYIHPFTDVPSWADKYVGYAYEKGLTKGTSATKFGTENASSAMYITFVLRALGYSDTNGNDFTWDNPYTLANDINIISSSVNINEFWRADAIAISHAALSAPLKNSNQTLAEKLISMGVFSQKQYDIYYDSDDYIPTEESKNELSAEEIYKKCAPAVFFIEVYDENGNPLGFGSGFFLDSNGLAATNYHVIEDGFSACAYIPGNDNAYKITGVHNYSSKDDWAIIRVEGNNFPHLNKGDINTITGGAQVYAIGNPLGLQSTISDGLISHPDRDIEGTHYIQTSAAISPGSSGGALINKYGDVVGITSAGFVEGQNLNLALPLTYLSGESSPLVSLQAITKDIDKNTSISYTASSYDVTLGLGETKQVWIDIDGNFNEETNFQFDIYDSNVVSAKWGPEESLPWSISVTGLSIGVTYISVYNDKTDDYMMIRVSVSSSEQSAYTTLCNFMKNNGYLSSDGDRYLLVGDDKCNYEILYHVDEDYISFMSYKDMDGDILFYMLNINNDFSPHFAFAGSMTPADKSLEETTGLGYVITSNLASSNADAIIWDKYTGLAVNKSLFSSLSASILSETLQNIENMLIEYRTGVSIVDFGFESVYREMLEK